MSSHGGNRSGAGRPKGGISQTRRLLSAAITRGLATAGRAQFGGDISQNDEQAATQTAAMIVSDMIQAGQGADVLKLWAQVSTKEADDQPKGSSLEEALKALPSASRVSLVAQDAGTTEEKPEITGEYIKGTTDNKSDALPEKRDSATFFAPQQPLLMDAPAASQPAGGHPPSSLPTHSIYPDTEIFEKNSELTEPEFGDWN